MSLERQRMGKLDYVAERAQKVRYDGSGLNLDSAAYGFLALGRMLLLSEASILTCKTEAIIIPS